MIKKSEYLPSYRRMSDEDKLEYLAGVDKWVSETYPRLAALDDSYKETDMKDFDEGLKLASALQNAQGYLESYMRYDAKRRLNVLYKLLSEVREKSGLDKLRSRPASDKTHYTAIVPPKPKVDEDGRPKPVRKTVEPEVEGRRPEHLSQYEHLLPESLRKESNGLQSLYDQLRHWRGRAEYLSSDPRANKMMIANCAKKAVKLESKILNFWQRVDIEYNKAVGKKVDSELDEELKKEAAELNKPETKSAGEYTKAEIDIMEDGEQKEVCKRARLEANRKFLRREDTQMTEERKEQIKLRIVELMEWGANITEKAKMLCDKYNIVVPGFNDVINEEVDSDVKLSDNSEDVELKNQ